MNKSGATGSKKRSRREEKELQKTKRHPERRAATAAAAAAAAAETVAETAASRPVPDTSGASIVAPSAAVAAASFSDEAASTRIASTAAVAAADAADTARRYKQINLLRPVLYVPAVELLLRRPSLVPTSGDRSSLCSSIFLRVQGGPVRHPGRKDAIR